MKNNFINPLKELDYAELTKKQEDFLRNLEKQFNSEFGEDFYFMVMKRDKTQS